MRKLLFFLVVIIASCKSEEKKVSDTFPSEMRTDTASLLYQYWILEDADHPLGRDVITKEGNKDMMPGIVFMNNGGVLENPGGITFRGTYQRNGSDIAVNYENGSTATYSIQILNKDTLYMARKTGTDVSELLYKATDAWWPDIATNPFTKENFSCTIKPSKPESPEEIRNRTLGFVRFYEYYLNGHVRGEAPKINFVGLPNIFNWYSGGIGLQSDKKLNPKWVDCYYNPEQAFEGYSIIRHAILKDYKWDKEKTDWIAQSAEVLGQMRDSIRAGN